MSALVPFYHGLYKLLSSYLKCVYLKSKCKKQLSFDSRTHHETKKKQGFVLWIAINKSPPENTKAHCFEKIKKLFINGLSTYACQLTVPFRSYKSKQKFTDIKACVSCQAIWGNHTFMCVIIEAFSPNIWNIIKHSLVLHWLGNWLSN